MFHQAIQKPIDLWKILANLILYIYILIFHLNALFTIIRLL